MERTISQEERIKRAEEIYYRRRLNNSNMTMLNYQQKSKIEKRHFSLYRKMAIQILVCILIYLVFSLIKEANYLFSEDVIGKTKEVVNQDINFEQISITIKDFFEKNKDKFNYIINNNTDNLDNKQNNIDINNTGNVQNNEHSSENIEQSDNKYNEQNNSNAVGMGGATLNENNEIDEKNKKTQMEIDAEYIKTNFNMQLPVKAVVTSKYGSREATDIISAEHYGIDLGVTVGTTIVAAMEGKVSSVSDEGEYGTHVKIENKDITTIYAHCSKILVKEGENITLGQKIALSGNTGKTTGPHLHFEIRRENRTVDPSLVLNF